MRTICQFVCLSIVVATPALAHAQAKPLSIEDLYRLEGPQSVTMAPDGKSAVYVRQWIDATTKQERFSLWAVDGDRHKVRPVEAGEPDARTPVYSPDGKWIAFLSTRRRPEGWRQIPATPMYSDTATDIWIMPARGGRATPLAGADKPYGRVFSDGFYGRIAFSPDSRKLVFVADDDHDSDARSGSDDAIILRNDQGEGYTGYGAAQIWIAHLDSDSREFAANRIQRLTNDDVWYGDPQWSPDGKTIAVHANRTNDRESVRYSINKNFDIWSIDAATGAVQQLSTGPGPEVSPRLSPDGKRIACLSVPHKGPHRDAFNLALITLGKGGPRTEVVFDHHGPDADRPPHPSPSFPLPEDCWDGEHFVFRASVGTRTEDVRVDLKTGKGEPLPTNPDSDAGTVAGRWSRQQQLTPAGNLLLKERTLGESKVVTWKNEGFQLEGVLTMPPAGVAQQPYKLLLYPHGGPHSRSTLSFNFLVEVFAAHGYAVFQPNFRGSDGYGHKFIDADRGDFGGGDMRDILTGIEHLVKQKIIDPHQQYVFGSSYGGFMTTWVVGHTHQFRAAAAQNAVTDLNAMWGLSDIQSWTEWEFGGRPWEVPALMHKHSPITYVGKVKTPTLIIHCRDDRRVPLPMGKMFYQSLLSRGIPTEMVIYPNEGHGIRQPQHREDVLRRTLAWFARHGG